MSKGKRVSSGNVFARYGTKRCVAWHMKTLRVDEDLQILSADKRSNTKRGKYMSNNNDV